MHFVTYNFKHYPSKGTKFSRPLHNLLRGRILLLRHRIPCSLYSRAGALLEANFARSLQLCRSLFSACFGWCQSLAECPKCMHHTIVKGSSIARLMENLGLRQRCQFNWLSQSGATILRIVELIQVCYIKQSMTFLNRADTFFQKPCRIIALNFLPISIALRNVIEHGAQQLPIIFLHTKF